MSGNGSQDENQLFLFSCAGSDLSNINISVPQFWELIPALLPTVPYMATIEAVFFFMASIWNLYILVGYLMHRKLLQEPANVFFLNLSIADFLLSWFILLNFVSQIQGGFLLGNSDVVRCGVCQFLGFYLVVLITATLHILAVLSIDRFVLLYKPVRYQDYFSWKKAMVIVIVIWILSIVLGLFPFVGFGSYEYSVALVSCQPTWLGQSKRGISNIYYSYVIAVEAMVPLVSLLLFNVFTYRIICKSLYSRFRRHLTFSENNSTTVLVRRTHRGNQKRVLYLFTALLIVNTINWVPVLTILSIVSIFGLSSVPLGGYLFGWLCYLLNPVLHPVIELCFIKGLRDLLTCQDKEHVICYKHSCCCKKDNTVLRLNTTASFRQQRAAASNGRTTFQVTNDLTPSPRSNGDATSGSSDDDLIKRPSISEMTKKFSFPFIQKPLELVEYKVSPRVSQRRSTEPSVTFLRGGEEEEEVELANGVDMSGQNRLSYRRQTVAVGNIILAQNGRSEQPCIGESSV